MEESLPQFGEDKTAILLAKLSSRYPSGTLPPSDVPILGGSGKIGVKIPLSSGPRPFDLSGNAKAEPTEDEKNEEKRATKTQDRAKLRAVPKDYRVKLSEKKIGSCLR